MKQRTQKLMEKNGLSLQVFLLIAVIFLTTVLSIVFSFFTGDINLNILISLNYWARQVSTAFTAFLLFVLTRQTLKIIEGNKNKEYGKLKKTLEFYYKAIEKENKFDEFHDFIRTENGERKLKAYTQYLQEHKLKHQLTKERLPEKAIRRRKRQEEYIKHYTELLTNAKTDVEFLNVNYTQISYSQIFSDDGQRQNNDEDFSTHEGGLIAQKAFFKLLWVFAFGLLFGLVGSSLVANEDIFTTILNITVMLIQFSVSIFFGGEDGVDFIKSTVNNKLRLRIAFVSKFCATEGVVIDTKDFDKTEVSDEMAIQSA